MDFSPGLTNAYSAGRTERTDACPQCGFSLPRYPGRYPAKCPSCGCDRCATEVDENPAHPATPFKERVRYALHMQRIAEARGMRYIATEGGIALFESNGRAHLIGVTALLEDKRDIDPKTGLPPESTRLTDEEDEDSMERRVAEITAPPACVAVIWRDLDVHPAVLLGRSTAMDDRARQWCFPGGAASPHDADTAFSAEREAFEETGVRCVSLGINVELPWRPNVVFEALRYIDGAPIPNGEFSDWRWSGRDDLHGMEDLHSTVEPVVERMLARLSTTALDAPIHIAKPSPASLGEAGAGISPPPQANQGRQMSGGSGAPKKDTEGNTAVAANAPKPPAPPERGEPRRPMPEPASDMANEIADEKEQGAEAGDPNAQPGVTAPAVPAGPKNVRLVLAVDKDAVDMEHHLRGLGVDAQKDGLAVVARAKDVTELEIVTRLAGQYGLELADAK